MVEAHWAERMPWRFMGLGAAVIGGLFALHALRDAPAAHADRMLVAAQSPMREAQVLDEEPEPEVPRNVRRVRRVVQTPPADLEVAVATEATTVEEEEVVVVAPAPEPQQLVIVVHQQAPPPRPRPRVVVAGGGLYGIGVPRTTTPRPPQGPLTPRTGRFTPPRSPRTRPPRRRRYVGGGMGGRKRRMPSRRAPTRR
jgi:hypothetical protein